MPAAIIAMSRQPKSEILAQHAQELGTPGAIPAVPAAAFTDLEMMFAGTATFTLENPATGKRYTYRINRVENEGRPPVYFVKYLAGPDNESDYQYLGMLGRYGDGFAYCRLTGASKVGLESDPVKGLNWLLGKLNTGATFATLPNGIRAVWSAICQRCGATLTVPGSIDARLGPVCAKKMKRGE